MSHPRLTALLTLLFAASTTLAQWQAAADAAIHTHRKAPLTVTVLGTGADTARVHVRQRESAFKWGTVVRVDRIQALADLGQPLTSDAPYLTHLLNFNSVTPGNAGKWKFWERAASREQYLEVIDWLASEDVANRGHGTIWPSIDRWNAVPADVVDMTDSLDANGDVVVAKNDRIRARVKAHIQSYVRALADAGVYELDLVNELVHEANITTDLMGLDRAGRIAEHTQWYQWAAEAAPGLPLVANEYDLYQSGGSFQQVFVDYVTEMIAAGAPVTRVGMQGHFFGTVPAYAELERRLGNVAQLGLPMSVTEFDMDGARADDIERALYAAFAHPLVYGFTVWGAWDGQQWRGNAPIWRENWTLKPSGRKYFELVHDRWRTDTLARVDDAGAVGMRAFEGTYDVFVERDGRIYRRDVTVGDDGATAVIDLDGESFPAPEAVLDAGDLSVVYPNQPVDLQVTAEMPIARVRFYANRRVVASRSSAPFAYTATWTAADSVDLAARVEYANGFTETVRLPRFAVRGDNTAPAIQRVTPGTGATFQLGEATTVEVAALDRDGESLTGYLLHDGDTLATAAADATGAPLRFDVSQLPADRYPLEILVVDERFGRDAEPYFLNVLEPGVTNRVRLRARGALADTEQRADGTVDGTGDLDLGRDLVAVQYPGAGLPAGARIAEAYVQFASQKDNQADTMTIDVAADATARSFPLRTGTQNISFRQATDASATWLVEAPWVAYGDATAAERTPSLVPVLGELVGLGDWSASSTVTLVFSRSPTGKRSALSADLSPALAPELLVAFAYDAPAERPAAPVIEAFTATGADGGTLTWDMPDPEGVTGYELAVAGDTLPYRTDAPAYALTGLRRGRTYVATARAVGALGLRGTPSEPFSFVFDGASGLSAWRARGITVAPNPTVADCAIASAHALSGAYTLIDAAGREVAAGPLLGTRTPLSLARLSAGVYRLSLKLQGGATLTRALVKA